MDSEILISRMYSGDYLNWGANIGHEIINLFKSDKGENFIYITPSFKKGSRQRNYVAPKHNDKVSAMLLTRGITRHKVEVLAKAEGLKQLVYNQEDSPNRRRTNIGSAIYGGKTLDEIFKNNIKNGVFGVFQAEKVTKVKSPVYITDNIDEADDTCIYVGTTRDGEEKKVLFGQTNNGYYCEDKDEGYKILENFMNDDSYWGEETKTLSEEKEIMNAEDSFNFLTLIHKEYDELAHSNMIAYYLSADNDLMQGFYSEVLKLSTLALKLAKKQDYTVKREFENIDILIETETDSFIIENKIKSGINGKKYDENGKEYQTQLGKYVQKIMETGREESQINCYLLVPNYNHIKLEPIQHLPYVDKYEVITYRDLYNYFNKEEFKAKNLSYYEDFLKALYKHSQEFDNGVFETMFKRFMSAIN